MQGAVRFEQAAGHFGALAVGLIGGQGAAGEVAVDLGQLVTIDFEVILGGRGDFGLGTDHGQPEQRQNGEAHAGCGDPEGDHLHVCLPVRRLRLAAM